MLSFQAFAAPAGDALVPLLKDFEALEDSSGVIDSSSFLDTPRPSNEDGLNPFEMVYNNLLNEDNSWAASAGTTLWSAFPQSFYITPSTDGEPFEAGEMTSRVVEAFLAELENKDAARAITSAIQKTLGEVNGAKFGANCELLDFKEPQLNHFFIQKEAVSETKIWERHPNRLVQVALTGLPVSLLALNGPMRYKEYLKDSVHLLWTWSAIKWKAKLFARTDCHWEEQNQGWSSGGAALDEDKPAFYAVHGLHTCETKQPREEGPADTCIKVNPLRVLRFKVDENRCTCSNYTDGSACSVIKERPLFEWAAITERLAKVKTVFTECKTAAATAVTVTNLVNKFKKLAGDVKRLGNLDDPADLCFPDLRTAKSVVARVWAGYFFHYGKAPFADECTGGKQPGDHGCVPFAQADGHLLYAIAQTHCLSREKGGFKENIPLYHGNERTLAPTVNAVNVPEGALDQALLVEMRFRQILQQANQEKLYEFLNGKESLNFVAEGCPNSLAGHVSRLAAELSPRYEMMTAFPNGHCSGNPFLQHYVEVAVLFPIAAFTDHGRSRGLVKDPDTSVTVSQARLLADFTDSKKSIAWVLAKLVANCMLIGDYVDQTKDDVSNMGHQFFNKLTAKRSSDDTTWQGDLPDDGADLHVEEGSEWEFLKKGEFTKTIALFHGHVMSKGYSDWGWTWNEKFEGDSPMSYAKIVGVMKEHNLVEVVEETILARLNY